MTERSHGSDQNAPAKVIHGAENANTITHRCGDVAASSGDLHIWKAKR